MTTFTMDLPEGVSADDARDAVALLASHAGVLRRLSGALAEEPTPTAPPVLAQLGRVDASWRAVESRWGLLTPAEVTLLTGGNPQHARSHTANLRRRHGVLAIARHGGLRYPGFQFADNGGVRSTWATVAGVLTEAGWSAEEIVLWAAAPTGWLDGRVPLEVLDDEPETVLAAARQVAEGTSA